MICNQVCKNKIVIVNQNIESQIIIIVKTRKIIKILYSKRQLQATSKN